MELTALFSEYPLTKRFTPEKKFPYPSAKNFSSEIFPCCTAQEFFSVVESVGSRGGCLLKGMLIEPLVNSPRAGKHDLDRMTEWVCLDFDDLQGVDDVDDALDAIGLGDVSHVLQYSASMGIVPDKGLSAHCFFLLDSPVSPQELKNWLIHLNLTTPLLRERIRLQRSGMALKWPLDPTVAQNDKLIYVAPPVLEGGLKDTLVPPRLSVRERRLSHLSVTPVETGDPTPLLNELRAAAGLPARTWATRTVFKEEVLVDPEPATSWELVSEARGFRYLNLNGGDSAGYFHPIDNPKVLRNFKGEPNYLTRELLPDYYPLALARAEEWEEEQKQARKLARERVRAERAESEAARTERERLRLQRVEAQAELLQARQANREQQAEEREQRAQERQRERDALMQATYDAYENVPQQGVRHLVAEDRQTGRYYTAIVDFDHDTVEIYNRRNRQSLIDFSLANNDFRPAYIPQWDVVYDFSTFERVNVGRRFLNLFEPTVHMLRQNDYQPAATPVIDRLLDSICGGCSDTRAHLFNWLAWVWQKRTKAKTAWILQGIPGTGKGVFFDQVLRPLFGQLAQMRTLDNLEEQYNGYMQQTLLLFIDESDTDKVKNLAKIVAKVKNWVTEPNIPIREMYTGQFQAPNCMNLIFASNRHNPMQIDKNDRRFNVAPRQEQYFALSEDDYQSISTELPGFVARLRDHRIDELAVRIPLKNEAKETIQEVTTDAPQDVADAIKEGNLRFFVDLLPVQDLLPGSDPVAVGYRDLVQRFMNEEISTLLRDDLQLVFRYSVGWEHSTAHKFSKAVSRYGLKLVPNWVDGAPVRSVRVSWKKDEETKQLFERLTTSQTYLRRVK